MSVGCVLYNVWVCGCMCVASVGCYGEMCAVLILLGLMMIFVCTCYVVGCAIATHHTKSRQKKGDDNLHDNVAGGVQWARICTGIPSIVRNIGK